MINDPAIILVGCGKMGSAMLQGWLCSGIKNIIVVDPVATHESVQVIKTADDIPSGFVPNSVVLAIKPQGMAEIVPAYARFQDAVFLSIAAGKTLQALEGYLGNVARVRAMPNLPATIGKGVSVVVASEGVSDQQRQVCDILLEAVGKVCWIEDEALMDVVTAVSGSGPAYVFHMMETWIAAGVKSGLSEALARELVYHTIVGSVALALQSDKDITTLREQVTSPGGTTQAALDVLMAEQGLEALMKRAIAAAKDRSFKLNQ